MSEAVTGYGALRAGQEPARLCARVGECVVDLVAALDGDALEVAPPVGDALRAPLLNPLMALGREASAELAGAVAAIDDRSRFAAAADATPVLPFAVADYVDFFASRHHAQNCGRMLRPGGDPLTPNWEWMPVGYHGRSGTVVVTSTPVRRPRGQVFGPQGGPLYGPSAWLDVEVELGFVVGTPSVHGDAVAIDDAETHLFGLVVLNDWSARDIQAWESQPLGPHLGKSFATSISAWVVPWDLLPRAAPDEPARDPLPYLTDGADRGLDIDVELRLNDRLVSRSNALQIAWTPAQLVAHLTAGGAHLRTGDLIGTGTISGPEPQSRGCLLERTWAGREPLDLGEGMVRTWLEDGDNVVIAARAGEIEIGAVSGRVEPAVG